MTDADFRDVAPGPGERNLRRRRNRKIAYYAVSGLVGMALGFSLSMHESGEGDFLLGDIAGLTVAPGVAIIIAIGFVVGLVAMPVWFYTQIDELQLHQNLVGMAGGCIAGIACYPTWAVLAMGGLAPAPTAFGVWAVVFAAMLASFLVAKLRS